MSEELGFTILTGSSQYMSPDASTVRRLTPLECERLQGFPDGWTAIEGASDTNRYRALGNSFAVPVVRWIGERIDMVEGVIRGGFKEEA